LQTVVKHTANESFYSYVVWAISIVGALSTYAFLNAEFALSLAFLMMFSGVLIVWCNKGIRIRKTCRATDKLPDGEKVYSFSRPTQQVIGDVLMKTVEMSFFSIILDLASKDVTLEKIFSSISFVMAETFDAQGNVIGVTIDPTWHPKLSLIVIGLQVLIYLAVMLLVYSQEAGNEQEQD
jgi:hypothetical protein